MNCPRCGKNLKGHAGGMKAFRELSRLQQKAAIAGWASILKKMKGVYRSEACKV